uniref:Aminotransferase class I/classII large domain-containing protein n=1 Tax=Eutreptiella gymnastica TaxID=73025 RepID=A0A7S1JB35_9EUGL
MDVELVNGNRLKIPATEMAKGLQYSPTPGLPPLLELLKARQQATHQPPYAEWDCIVSGGSQDLLSKVFDMLVNEGDSILLEEPTYSGALAAIAPLGCNLVGVPTDAHGIIPSELQTILDRGTTAKVLYTIPTGQNPSGCTTSADRRKEVYALASKHDLIILEDDPYYYLYLDADQPASYLSMDTEGRVFRMESFSKVLSAGVRIGFATGPKRLIDQMGLDMQATCMHASGVSQSLILALLKEWGDDGWQAHVESVKNVYRRRRELFLSLCDKHLTGLAEWHAPSAGMFVWFRLIGIEDSSKLITEKAMNQKVLLVPGESFLTDPDGVSGYVRAAYSLCTEDDMEEGVKRFAALLRAERP